MQCDGEAVGGQVPQAQADGAEIAAKVHAAGARRNDFKGAKVAVVKVAGAHPNRLAACKRGRPQRIQPDRIARAEFAARIGVNLGLLLQFRGLSQEVLKAGRVDRHG